MFSGEGLSVTTIAAAALLAVVLAVAVLLGARPAAAAFEGANGKIAFVSNRTAGPGVNNPTGDSEIFLMDPDGTDVEQLTTNTVGDQQPAWSPQGNAIAFISRRDGNDTEIYFMIYGGVLHGLEVRLTNNTVDDEDPAWSPDGTKMAFRRDVGNNEVYVMDTSDTNGDGNGDNQINLTNNSASDFGPAWSTDGSGRIAFTSNRDGDNEIFTMDTDPSTNDGIALTNNAASDFYPNWSPTGSKIAFTRLQDGNWNIYVMNGADGTEQKRLTKNAAEDSDPAFSPSGTRIAFTSTRGGDYEIYVMKPRPEGRLNRPKNLTKNDVWGDIDPDWQPIPQQ